MGKHIEERVDMNHEIFAELLDMVRLLVARHGTLSPGPPSHKEADRLWQEEDALVLHSQLGRDGCVGAAGTSKEVEATDDDRMQQFIELFEPMGRADPEGDGYAVGEQVEALHSDLGRWFTARVTAIEPDGSYLISWFDGDSRDREKTATDLRR